MLAGPARARRVSEEESPWLTILFIIAVLLLLAGMVGFHALRKGDYGRIGRTGFYTVSATGVVTLLIPDLMFPLSPSNILVSRPISFLGVLTGFALYDAATSQARVLPR